MLFEDKGTEVCIRHAYVKLGDVQHGFGTQVIILGISNPVSVPRWCNGAEELHKVFSFDRQPKNDHHWKATFGKLNRQAFTMHFGRLEDRNAPRIRYPFS
jgi:hypothetical protein